MRVTVSHVLAFAAGAASMLYGLYWYADSKWQ